jgi:anaerobic selenocysteine-containing dehydrogenase
MRAAVQPPPGVLDGVLLAAELGRRLGLELPDEAPAAFAEMAATRPAFAALSWHEIGESGEQTSPPPRPAQAPPQPQIGSGQPEGTIVVGYRQLMSGPAVDHAPVLHFQRRTGIEIAHDDAQAAGIATGDRVEVEYDGQTHAGPAIVQRRLRPGVVRLATSVPYVGPGQLRPAHMEADGA